MIDKAKLIEEGHKEIKLRNEKLFQVNKKI